MTIMAAIRKPVSTPELNKSQDAAKKPMQYPFWFGGSASCFATFFTHPLDLSMLLQLQCDRWLMII
jgi:dicarboxylate transporter 10